MKKIFIVIFSVILLQQTSSAQKPCSLPIFRQFDFWVGQWEAYGAKGNKAGDSKISIILDSCVILEEWTSTGVQNGLVYTGKSFNTYNVKTKEWQQTWVDNVGGTTEYLEGHYEDNKMIFKTKPFPFSKDTMAVLRLTFFDLGPDKVRQFSEISKDNEKTWATQYDLEYRRKKM